MKKTKKKPNPLQVKISNHKALVKSFSKAMSDTFLMNRLAARTMVSTADIDPFHFVLKIQRIPGLTITGVNINGVASKKDDFEIDDNTITCTMEAFVSIKTFLLLIDAVGNAGTATTFSMTCDTKSVFGTPADLTINAKGRGGYNNPKVPLP
ncbi:MAG: hypothetical protein U0289_18155 [Cyclobacteriaceae bacterium]